MNSELLQATMDIVFQGHLKYVAPFLFLMMAMLFADRLIELIFNSFSRNNRRGNY